MGLGNIGKEYEKTRHNIGFLSVDSFANKNNFPGWVNKKDLHAGENSLVMGGNKVILAKPTTMMNDSGRAVGALQRYYRVDNAHTLVIHDELDIDFGKIRLRRGGSDAGNNGVKSLIEHGIDETWRARVGIGPKTPEQMNSVDFVLGKFSKTEQEHLDKVLKGTQIIISEYIHSTGELTSETRSFIE